jgi:phage terminase large subunit
MAQTVIDFTDFYKLINPAFWDFFDNKDRIRISLGGGGSSKSYSGFQDALYKLIYENGHNFLICRKVANTSKTSTYALMKQIITDLNLWSVIKENKSDLSFTCTRNNNMMICKGLDDIEKLKSITFPNGILTDIIVEEATEITQKDFDQLNIRLRGKKKPKNVPFQITLLLNPIHDKHWIKREFFDLQSYQTDRFDDSGNCIHKGTSVYILHTTYKDNLFIDDEYRQTLENYKVIDEQMYRVYCLGEWGCFGNVIFNNWTAQPCPYGVDDFDAVYYGQDYGYNHPSVISCIGLKDGNLYSFDELCVFEKTNKEFIETNEEYNILPKNKQALGDSAEPARIKEWQKYGYAVIGAKKGAGSVRRGIDFLKSHKWFIDPNKCPRLLQEVQTFHWKTNKAGDVVTPEEPVELDDDAIKATFYALEPISKMRGKPGVLSGTQDDHKKEAIQIRRDIRHKERDIAKAMARRKREEREKNRK